MTEIDMEQTERAPAPQARGGWFATGAGVAGALAMTSCCILPWCS